MERKAEAAENNDYSNAADRKSFNGPDFCSGSSRTDHINILWFIVDQYLEFGLPLHLFVVDLKNLQSAKSYDFI